MKTCQFCQDTYNSKDKLSKYCSKSCAAKYNNTQRTHTETTKSKIKETMLARRSDPTLNIKRGLHVENICKCGAMYLTKASAGYQRKFCNKNCPDLRLRQVETGSIAGKVSAAKNIRRSKDEIELYEKCFKHFHDVTHNVPIVDGWDADIILNEHKIAILWNGIWHREQLSFSNHSLKQVQTRDRIKTKTLIDYGWQVIVFEDNQWTPLSAFEHLKLVVQQ